VNDYLFLESLGLHTWGFWLVLLLISGAVGLCLLLGFRFLFRRRGEPRSFFFLSLLLLAFGFTQIYQVWRLLDLFSFFPKMRYVPIYFSLALPVLFFYYVKVELFPAYRLRWTDAKHFLLPGGQFFYFLTQWIFEARMVISERLLPFNPFFGSVETALYLVLFAAYLFFSLRYIVQKKRIGADIRKQRQVLYLEILVQLFSGLFLLHSLFILFDYYTYRFVQYNVQSEKLYVGFGVLTFTSLLGCLAIYGVQLLGWGRRSIYP